jgi:hypothetical protein
VIDRERQAVEIARLLVADDVVVDRCVTRIEVGVRFGGYGIV